MVDDNRTFLVAAQHALASVDGLTVVGHAVCGRDALAQLEVLKPDVVLLDIGLPDISGIEVGMHLRACAQPPRIVFVSLHDETIYAAMQQQVGAVGFVTKANFVTELLPLLKSIVQSSNQTTHK